MGMRGGERKAFAGRLPRRNGFTEDSGATSVPQVTNYRPSKSADALGDGLRGWAGRIRTKESVREPPNWICVIISPKVGASLAAETRRVRAALYGFAAPANSAGVLSLVRPAHATTVGRPNLCPVISIRMDMAVPKRRPLGERGASASQRASWHLRPLRRAFFGRENKPRRLVEDWEPNSSPPPTFKLVRAPSLIPIGSGSSHWPRNHRLPASYSLREFASVDQHRPVFLRVRGARVALMDFPPF
jgi:hypothetical protein